MIGRFRLSLALALMGIAGCPKAGESSAPPSAEGLNSRQTTPAATLSVAPPPMSSGTPASPDASAPAAPDEVIGTLGTSKGFASLGGVLLRRSEVKAQLGNDWQTFVGRRVRARGRRHDYRCGPQEQCLISGVIPLLTDLVSVELCRGGGASEPKLVECPLSDAETERCLTDCKRESDECDKSAAHNRGRLRRCGCAWISCKNGCKKDGFALFACR